MSQPEYQKLREEIKKKRASEMSDLDSLGEFLVRTMRNFAYRYFESESTGLSEFKKEGNIFRLEVTETQMKEALKAQNPETRKALIELAKKVPRKEGPTVFYAIECVVYNFDPDRGGKMEVRSIVSWDHPRHESGQKRKSKMKILEVDGILELRKFFPVYLEEVCEVF